MSGASVLEQLWYNPRVVPEHSKKSSTKFNGTNVYFKKSSTKFNGTDVWNNSSRTVLKHY